ncbi:hypothetical protein [Pedobacter glucosidilyticus]|uniref:DUF7935 family protein n=1 Tax=Pedobacter glucosidilyticus TaxID=1122941 RepID=UPI000409E06F|nr:hypothetical protein [Pedobacter glucosidilyticus]
MQIFVFTRINFTNTLQFRMDALTFLLDVLKYTLSGFFVILGSYFLFKSQFDAYYNLKELEYRSSVLKDVLPLRLQAYERMTLFIERINPSNLLLRLHVSGMSAKEMQNLILTEVRAEYQHNLAQQIYLTNDAWQIIKRVKDDTISIINSAVKNLPADASAVDLSKVVFSRLDSIEENPYELALLVIKKDIQEM